MLVAGHDGIDSDRQDYSVFLVDYGVDSLGEDMYLPGSHFLRDGYVHSSDDFLRTVVVQLEIIGAEYRTYFADIRFDGLGQSCRNSFAKQFIDRFHHHFITGFQDDK